MEDNLINKRISIKIDPALWTHVEQWAKSENMTVSDFTCFALQQLVCKLSVERMSKQFEPKDRIDLEKVF